MADVDREAESRTELAVVDLKGEPAGVVALAAGASIVEAARKSGVSERTIRRRLLQPSYRAEIAVVRAKILDKAVGKLTVVAADAVDTLKALLRAESENVRLGAAKAILEQGLSLSESLQTTSRITALEEVFVHRRTEHMLGNPGA